MKNGRKLFNRQIVRKWWFGIIVAPAIITAVAVGTIVGLTVVNTNNDIGILNNYGFVSAQVIGEKASDHGDYLVAYKYILNTLSKVASNGTKYKITAVETVYKSNDEAKKHIQDTINSNTEKAMNTNVNNILHMDSNNTEAFILYMQNKFISIQNNNIERDYYGYFRSNNKVIEFESTTSNTRNDKSRGYVYYGIEHNIYNVMLKFGCKKELLNANFTDPKDLNKEQKIIDYGYNYASEMDGSITDESVQDKIKNDTSILNVSFSDFEKPEISYIKYDGGTSTLGLELSTEKKINNWSALATINIIEFTSRDIAKDYFKKDSANDGFSPDSDYKVDIQSNNYVGYYRISKDGKLYARPDYYYRIISDNTVVEINYYDYNNISDNTARINEMNSNKQICLNYIKLIKETN